MKFISIFALLFSLHSLAFAADSAEEQAMYQKSLTSEPGTGLADKLETEAFPRITVQVPKLISKSGSPYNGSLQTGASKCTTQGSFARGLCLTSMNPKIAAASTGITALLTAMDMTAGQKESCEKFGSAMDLAKAAVTAYTTACGGARLACTMSCESLARTMETALSMMKAAAASSTVDQSEAAALAKDIPALEAVAAKLRSADVKTSVIAQCDKYKLKLAAGAAGLIQIVQSAKGGKKCEDQLAANDGSSTNLDCSKPENAKVVECICRANPTTAGCVGGGTTGNSNDPYQTLTGEPLPRAEGDGSSSGNIDLSSAPAADSSSPFANSGSDSSGGALGGSGGGGGGGGFPLSGTGKAADTGSAAGKPLNKNILSGYEGGGGGGGGGGGYSDNAYADQYKQFMPGGEKDPARNPSSFAGGQVTGNDGKSNWEKVRERYQANRPSLIVGGP